MDNSKNCPSDTGNKFIRYYNPEGENNAFKSLNGAFQRGVEEEASIQTAVKMKQANSEEKYKNWVQNHSSEPEMEKRAKLEFIKKCEELALLPEKELIKLCERSSERLSQKVFPKSGELSAVENEINERAYMLKHTAYTR